MARTQAADYEQRREAIVEKAAHLFASTGFMGASVSDLAAACETSKSLIYHYYPSKEDILYAVMTSHVDQLTEDVAKVMAREAPAAELLRDLVHAFMNHYLDAADRQKVLLNELERLPADKRRTIVTKQRRIIDAVAELIGNLDTALAADPDRVRVQTMLLFGMINWTHTWFNPDGPVSADELADMAVTLVLPRRADQAS
jgi:AcrR family transcriptional regulator